MIENDEAPRLWTSSGDLHRQLADQPNVSAIRRGISLWLLLEDAIFGSGYIPDIRWLQAIVPSDYGRQALEVLGKLDQGSRFA